MRTSLPLASVNIRTYNSEKTLGKTLDSVRKQSYQNIEIVVSDGYSKDRSVEIAKKYKARVNYAQKLGDARYKNYEKSKGKYILSLDSDQVLDSSVIESCVMLCEEKKFDAVTISEKSLVGSGTLLEKLIAYDKWVIDQSKDADADFGTACPRFFRKKLFDSLKWPEGLAVFDDTILYKELLKNGAKVAYLSEHSVRHHEVSSWIVFFKKFIRYGKGYPNAFKSQPSTIAAHSLPRRSYFSKAALSKPHYFLGLLLLYLVKGLAAGTGVISYFIENLLVSLRRWLVNIGDAPYYWVLEKELRGSKSVLDVGCGSNSPLLKIRKNFYSEGVDVFGPSIKESKKAKIHDKYKVGDILNISRFFKPKSFDSVIALDVIEHFDKKEGLKLMDYLENIAKKKVIIFTPFGFTQQHPSDGNPFQKHKSGWYIEDFKKRGYTVYGMRGFRFIRGEYATIRYKPWFFWGTVSSMSQFLVYNYPKVAYQLLAVKNINL